MASKQTHTYKLQPKRPITMSDKLTDRFMKTQTLIRVLSLCVPFALDLACTCELLLQARCYIDATEIGSPFGRNPACDMFASNSYWTKGRINRPGGAAAPPDPDRTRTHPPHNRGGLTPNPGPPGYRFADNSKTILCGMPQGKRQLFL